MRSPKRLAAVGLAAALAAGPFVALPAPATAATPGYVAIVVDGHTSACVKYTSGITGDAVLNAVAQVHYRNDGLIDAIDNYPSPPHADDTHYWSYWHDTSASWSYSTLGASSFKPKAGSVEGWRFDNGSDPAPAPAENPSGLYAKLCGAHDKSSSSSGATSNGGTSNGGTSGGGTSSRTSGTSGGVAVKHASGRTGTHEYRPRSRPDPGAGSSTSSSPRTSSTAAGPSTTPSRRSGSPSSRSGSTSSGSGSSSARPSSPGPGEASSPSNASSSPVAAAPVASVDASPAAASSSDGSSGTLTSVLIGLGLVLILGGGAAVVVLRRRADVE